MFNECTRNIYAYRSFNHLFNPLLQIVMNHHVLNAIYESINPTVNRAHHLQLNNYYHLKKSFEKNNT